MTTNEITDTARAKVLEDTTDIITDATVLLYANLSYQDVWKAAFAAGDIITADISCSAGVCTLPTRYGRMYAKGVDQDGNEYEEVSIANYHQSGRNFIYTIDEGDLLISSTDVTTLTVRYFEEPETLTASVNPSIDTYFHESIMYGTVWRLHEDLQDEELSIYYKKVFADDLRERMSKQSSYEETNQKGGEMFTYQKLI